MTDGTKGPAHMLAAIPNREAMVDQYIRHVDTGEIFQIKYVGREGVTAYRADGFGEPAKITGDTFEITWRSLKYKHRFMVHVADIEAKPEHLQ